MADALNAGSGSSMESACEHVSEARGRGGGSCLV